MNLRRPSPAMVVGLLALFVALGGVGVAANGDRLILGQSNSATSSTSLSAPVAGGSAFGVTNNASSGIGGRFTSSNVGLQVSGSKDGIQTSATGATKSGIWAHHDGSNYGYGVFAQSAVGPALGLTSNNNSPPITLNGQPFPSVTAGYKDNYGLIPNDNTMRVIAQLPISTPGTYAIFLKANLDNVGAHFGGSEARFICFLGAGGDSDEAMAVTNETERETVVPMMVFHRFSAAGNVTFSCRESDSDSGAIYDVKISAIKLAGGTNTALP
jgi:hypothetical protein